MEIKSNYNYLENDIKLLEKSINLKIEEINETKNNIIQLQHDAIIRLKKTENNLHYEIYNLKLKKKLYYYKNKKINIEKKIKIYESFIEEIVCNDEK